MGEEKRRYERVNVDYSAQCTLSETSFEYFTVKISDIGPEGIGFVTDQELDNHTNVYFKIDFETGESVKLSTEVMWISPLKDSAQFRVGAKIFEADQKGLEKFTNFYFRQLFSVDEDNVCKKKILVVEDETVMANLLKVELTASGYDVICAGDGESGFAQYESEKPDLIILDIMLPKLNGYEVCRKIRREKEDNDTPIIMLTAKSSDVDRVVGGVIGAHKYIPKPFEAEHLLREIDTLLNPPDA